MGVYVAFYTSNPAHEWIRSHVVFTASKADFARKNMTMRVLFISINNYRQMARRLHLSAVMEQINDDSDWCNSDDDLVGDNQDGDLEMYISGRGPLDRAADEAEHDEGDTPTQTPVHHEDEDAIADDDENEDDMDNISHSGEQCPSSTSTQQVLGLPTDL